MSVRTDTPPAWSTTQIGALAAVDPENIPAAAPRTMKFRYISLENVNVGTLTGWSEEVLASAPSRARRVLHAGDVLFATVRPHLQSHLLFMDYSHTWVASTGFAVIRCDPRLLDPRFLYYHLFTTDMRHQLDRLLVGSSYPAINNSAVRSLEIPCPPLAEQRAIAEVLGDVDALIDALQGLIAKKRNMLTAASQSLLSASLRLPGFTAAWDSRILGSVARFQVGFPFSSTYFTTGGGGVRLIRNADLKSDVSVVGFTGYYDSEFAVVDGDLLIGMDGEFVVRLWNGGPAILNQRVGRLVCGPGLDKHFAAYALSKYLTEIERRTSATTVKHLSHGATLAIELPLPSIKEQREIGEVLSDMDAEIEALEGRLEKTRNIKIGMAQELLSGRTRLV
jgi:type I restriction enzyme S subunit